ncbi:hypothetical protein [Terrabacter tumescens]|uniref:hypothetical protein n=1 Tax=Terrabacter tumescens TaxID=60443 RepID=UPI0004BFEBE0|nr:hypothetical protein [Terrabacter tumescens]
MPRPSCSQHPSTSPAPAEGRCWTWPAAQQRRLSGVLGVGRARQRRLRSALCRVTDDGREHDSTPHA